MGQVHVTKKGKKQMYGQLDYSGIFTRHIPSCDLIRMDRSISLEKQMIKTLREKGCQALQLIVTNSGRRLFYRIALERAIELATERGELDLDKFRVRIDDCRMVNSIPVVSEIIKMEQVKVEVPEPVKASAQQKLFELTQRYDY
jgi:hypothetical protein